MNDHSTELDEFEAEGVSLVGAMAAARVFERWPPSL